MKLYTILLLLIASQVKSQSPEGIYRLNNIDSLLSKEVKLSLDRNIIDKRVVLLGESEHHIGSDFLAKTEFVKYLVLNHGFKDIAFESDFFALYNEHDPKNLFPIWSRSLQCQNLFDFLKKHNVTIWGFDSQFSSIYSFRNFSPLLFHFLKENQITYDASFETQVEKGINQKLKGKEIPQLIAFVDGLLQDHFIQENHFWHQMLQSFKSLIKQGNSKRKLGIAIRDEQMASNLHFLTSEHMDKKFIVWAANGHISKLDLPSMKKQTMGFQYLQLNPDSTYHIAFSSIKMPYRKENLIEQQKGDPNNLLYMLPSISENYYVESKTVTKGDINQIEKEYDGMFGPIFHHTPYFKHFDALVFIANGEKSKLLD